MKTKLQLLCILLAWFAGLHQATAQGTTAFTYQGQLKDNGTNANGTYTMIFKLYDALSSGTQIGTGITNTTALANGLFTVSLDFGNVFNGGARWLDITVQSGSDTQTLSPRVQVLPAPYAQFAAVAAIVTNGAITSAQIAANAVTAPNLQAGAVTNRNLTANAVNATNIAGGQVVKSLNGLTDIVSLSAGSNVTLTTNGNILQIGGTAAPNGIQVFTSSGTFTVPAGITRIQVEAWGGGGGGGGSYSGASGSFAGGGGGSGGYGIQFYNVTPGGSFTVTLGSGGGGGNGGNDSTSATAGSAGGSSSFGGTLIVNGGGGGGNGATSSANGTGGAKPNSASGSAFPAGVGGGGNGGINFSGISIGGQGGSAFRGGSGALGGPAGGVPNGHLSGNSGLGADGNLGAGGGGGGIGGGGGGGCGGAVIITY
jgi:hypothetical protein